ncbi:hypothetical protein RV07_GL003983 [Enterococcus malodoratus]|nr:hypothetical protein RV07_GL003983 [Enterococcus malodoratus]
MLKEELIMKELFDPKRKEEPKKHTAKEFEKLRIELEAKSRLFTTSLGMLSYQKYHDLYDLN